MPLWSTIAALAIPAITGGIGAAESIKAGGRQQKALTQQEQIAQQEMQDKQQIFKQLTDFFTPYLKEGSPFLEKIQSAAAGQNAQETNNAAGQFREEMGATGTGYGPSGSTAAGLSRIGSNAATTGASNYLADLLNNEQIKFNAAKGLESAGTMAGSQQNQPNVNVNLPSQSGASGISAFGDVLKNILKSIPGASSNQPPNNLPLSNAPFNPIPIAPPTQGWSGASL